MKNVVAAGTALASLVLVVAFASALPAAAEKERVGRENRLTALCEPALRPEKEAPALGPLPSAAPNFKLADWNGHEVSLADTRGRVVLLNFWATWCPTCVVEMPALNDLARAEKGRPFSLLAVTVDESWDPVSKFFTGKPTEMTVLLDAEKRLPERYGTSKFPETFILDKQGRVRYYVVSDREWNQLDVRACLEALEDE